MNRLMSGSIVALGCLLLAGAPVAAQEMPGEEEADVPVQAAAVEAVDAMAAHLRTLTGFRVVATTTSDDLLDNGQLVQIAGVTTIAARLPDRLRVTVDNDKQERIYIYDGATVTQYAPALDYYSVFDAPDTIAATIVAAQQDYGVELPLADLFFWAAPDTPPVELELAYFVGETLIQGNVCRHYAYRVKTADVQLWIRKDGDPLPCRMVIVNTTEDARPQYGATFVWDVDPVLGEGLFGFAPPPGVEEIPQQHVVTDQ